MASIWSYPIGAGHGKFLGSKFMKQRVGMEEAPAQEKARLAVWQIKDGKVVWLKGSVLDGAEGQPTLATGMAVSSRQARFDPGFLKVPTGKIKDWPEFGLAGLAGLDRITAGQSGVHLVDFKQDCSMPQRQSNLVAV